MKMHFWRRKKREEVTANNINAGNGETGIVAVMENAQWASVSDFGGVAVAMGCNGRATARGYLGVALATRTQGEAKAVGEWGLAVATGMIGEARAEGADGVATTTNAGGRVMGALGCALFAVERDEERLVRPRHLGGGRGEDDGLREVRLRVTLDGVRG